MLRSCSVSYSVAENKVVEDNEDPATTATTEVPVTQTQAVEKRQPKRQPPVWFDLTEKHPEVAWRDINKFTNNLLLAKNYDVTFTEQLRKNVLESRSIIVGYIPAPPRTQPNHFDVVKQVIGTHGNWLKKTTETCGVHLIWYDSTLNNFLFWAPNRMTIVRAMNAIRWRVIKYYEFVIADPVAVQVCSAQNDRIAFECKLGESVWKRTEDVELKT